MIDNKTGDRRLLTLAALLRTLPRKRFNFNHWVGLDWKGAADLSCGTQACAFGWATTIPSFRRLGLRLVKDQGEPAYVQLRGMTPSEYTDKSIQAAEVFFGLSEPEARFLFIPDKTLGGRYSHLGEGATPKQVAKNIEGFVLRRTGLVPK
jgi:hypothetical protein